MNRLVASIAGLSPQQRALLELRLLKKGHAKPRATIERRPSLLATIPLSFAQERLWFIQQMLPDSTAYNVRSAVRLRGRLDPRVLARTLGEIVRRHEVLGSAFPLDGERPVQTVSPWQPFALPQVDLAGIRTDLREAEAVRVAVESSALVFDLLKGPVFRALYLRLAQEEHVILLVMHHVVSDGWSMEILRRELAMLYAAFSRGEPSPLPELPIQYADFAHWQREWLQGEILEAQLGVWKRLLQGAPEVIELPTDRPRPSTQSFRGASLPLELPASLQSAMRELSRRQGTTLFMTVLTAFQVLLHRYTGQYDIVVGTPIAGRNRVEIENLIGCFVNTLVLRLSFAGDPAFLELLGRVREVSLEAYAHQDLPFEKLVEELQPKRSLSHQPLFQVVFALDSSTEARSEVQDVALLPFEVESHSTKFDWVLMLQEQREGLSGSWSFDTDLFDRSSMMRTIDHLTTLLAGIVRDPGRSPARLPMLSEAERQQVSIEWNDTASPPLVTARFIHDLFEAQVERTPDAPAVLTHGGRLTYREVDQRANQLAHALHRLGVGPGTSVAVLLERSLEMVPALLGILKAGGAYVPLEPIFGKTRIHWILSSLEARWIVTQTAQLPLLAELDELPELRHVLCLDAAPSGEAGGTGRRIHSLAEISLLPVTDPRLRDPAGEMAYTIYTSGSTGNPKGVQVCHRPAINLIDWVNRTFEVGPGDRLLFTVSLCFDLSVYDIFGILAAGGSIRIASGEEARDPERLLEILLQEPITFWDSAPAALQQLVPFFPPAAGAAGDRLRLVFLSGDWIPVTLPDRLRAVFPRARVIALGGATEATVWSNSFPIGNVDPRWPSIPYGRPIRNARYHILDPHLSPCPVRVPGELFIAGGCLSEGYANEPVLTAQRYVPDFLGEEAGARMYRTGDRARLFPDGTIEFLGRLDHQVKIRGFRIELGDIEVTLRQHPGVRDVVVMARGNPPADMRLVAYFVPREDERPTVSTLRAFLHDKLPAYMVPAAFVDLESFPVTANGKLDRQALPAVEWSRPEDGEELTAPRTPVEKRLVEIWSQVLGVGKVGVHDNFFELGGDSILAIQMVSRANQAGLRVSVRQTFQQQTIAELASVAGTEEEVVAEQGAVIGPVPLTPIQSWFLEQDIRDPHHWNQSLLFEAREPQKPSALRAAVRHLLLHHDALRLRFSRAGSGWRQECSAPDGADPFHHLDLSALPEEFRPRALEPAAAGVQASLDPASGPLMRVVLFAAGPGTPDRLLLTIHHLVVDGLSWRVLLEDLRTAYRQASGGQPVQLPAKTSSFKEWSLQLARHAETEELAGEAAYWLDMLPTEAPPLPVDGSGGRNTVASLGSVEESLTVEETRALLQELPTAFHTEINEVLLTALVRGFRRWTGTPRLLLDLEGHGREGVFTAVDVSRTVGWFTSIMPVSLELSPEAGLLMGLRSVKEQLRRMPHRGARYGLLRYLCPDEALRHELRRRPQPEVSFNYLGRFDQGLPEGDSPFELSPLSKGPDRSPAGSRRHLLEISARVVGGCLYVQLAYSEACHRRSTMENLARDFVSELRALIALGGASAAQTRTASDFPLARLDREQLHHLSALIDAAGGLEEGEDLENNVEDVYPLSPLQESLLVQALSAHGSGAGFEQSAYTIHGSLDAVAFAETWRRILARHTVLRTGFFAQGLDRPVQVVRQQVRLPLLREDWSEISAAEQRHSLDHYLASDQEKGFDPTRSPLMRLAVFALSASSHFFVWSFHHLLLDGWSRVLVLREVLAVYEALVRGEAPELPTGPPFRDYIAWVQRQDALRAEAFWRASFASFTGPTPLVIDRLGLRPAEAATETRGSEITEEITEDDAARLRSFARQNQLTLGSLVQGAWALLLARYSGRDEVVYGSAVSGRPGDLPGIEGTVGMFVNNLPVRVQAAADSRVLPWLHDLQARFVELRQYEHCSPQQIQDWVRVPWGVRLYQSLVVFQNFPDGKVQQGDSGSLAVEPYQSRLETNLPLTLIGSGSGAGLRLRLLARGERFEAATVARMTGHLASLLASFAANPTGKLCEARLLTSEERHQLLAEDPGLPWREPAPLPAAHQLFVAAARRSPGLVAVSCGGSRLTYREMDRHSDRLAHDLRRLGVRAGEAVAIAMEPCMEAVLALLAILKAGGVAWPLDPAEADDRLARSRSEAGSPVLLVRAGSAAVLASGARVLQVAAEGSLSPDLKEPPADAGSEQPALLSGPADVWISHRILAGLCRAAADRLGLGQGDVFLAAGSRSWWVGSVLDILVPLSAGAALAFPDPAERADPRLLAQALAVSGATFVQATPGTWSALLDLGWPAERRLTALSCGEALARGLADLLLAATGTLWTIYTPEGSCLWAALNRVQPGAAPLSLGAPLSGLRLEILDRHLQPVPAGIPGEICLSSRPDLPRLRTRDLARFLPDGTLEFLGSTGDWSEIRGDRLQLGEVEALLRRLPAVREAALTSWKDAAGETVLAACVGLDRERTVAAAELRQILRRALPPNLVPAVFVTLEALPRTADGRLDRAALPRLGESGSTVLASFASPRDPVELQLVQIWEEVLGLRAIGIHDDFFSVGGHSLPAVQVMARIKERFGLELPLAALFESSTVEKLAVQLRQSAAGRPPSVLVPIQPRGSRLPFFCIHGLGGEVLIYSDLARCLGVDQPVYGIQAPLLTDLGDRCSPLQELAAEYLQALREVQLEGPYALGGYSYGSIVAFEMAQQLKRNGEPVGLLAMLDGPSPLVARKGERRSDVVMMAGLARSTARQSGVELSLPHEELQALPPNEALAHILAELHKTSLLPAGFDLAWVQRALRGVRLREEAVQQYEPEPYDGTITLFRSTETEIESARAWREIGVDVEDRTRGWDELSTRPVEVRYVPGYHATILTLPNVRILAASLNECLDRINETSD